MLPRQISLAVRRTPHSVFPMRGFPLFEVGRQATGLMSRPAPHAAMFHFASCTLSKVPSSFCRWMRTAMVATMSWDNFVRGIPKASVNSASLPSAPLVTSLCASHSLA